jgi:hypothetical protein
MSPILHMPQLILPCMSDHVTIFEHGNPLILHSQLDKCLTSQESADSSNIGPLEARWWAQKVNFHALTYLLIFCSFFEGSDLMLIRLAEKAFEASKWPTTISTGRYMFPLADNIRNVADVTSASETAPNPFLEGPDML